MHRKTKIVFVKHLIILWTKFAHSTSTLTSIHNSIYLTLLGAWTKSYMVGKGGPASRSKHDLFYF